MNGFLTNLNAETAQGLIVQMTQICQTIRDEIVWAQTEETRAPALARFARLNAQRIALIEEHHLQQWAATL